MDYHQFKKLIDNAICMEDYFLLKWEVIPGKTGTEDKAIYECLGAYPDEKELLDDLRKQIAGYGDLNLVVAKKIDFNLVVSLDK